MLDKTGGRSRIVFFLLIGLAAAIILSVMIGRYLIPPGELLQVIGAQITGKNPALEQTAGTVLVQVRLARIAGAVLIGGALSMAGAAYQGIFRNPMVSPDILGASAGASFGASFAILMGFNTVLVQVLAFVCGILAVQLAMLVSGRLARGGNGTVLVLVLTGMVVSALFSAFVSITKYVADPYDTLPAITFWLMGGLSYITGQDVLVMLAPLLLGALPLLLLRWRLNVLSLEEEEAKALGVDTVKLRAVVIFCATLMSSSSVAVAGMIGWVGLIIPHMARMTVGPDYKVLLPVSLLMGGLFLLLVDDFARCAFAQEIPLGILTAIAGAPFFLYLISQGRRGWI